MLLLKYSLFILLQVYISHWFTWNSLIKGLLIEKSVKKHVDKELLDFIYKKTGVKLSSFNLQTSNRKFAYCGWLFGKPLLVISTGAYTTFSKNALHWLVLHEIGHYKLFHTLWYILIELFYLALGIVLLSFIQNLFLFLLFGILIALVLGIFSVQTCKLLDLWANHYAVIRLDNPLAMAEGGKLLMDNAKEKKIYHDTFAMKFFYAWNYGMWDKIIRDAEIEVKRRNKR